MWRAHPSWVRFFRGEWGASVQRVLVIGVSGSGKSTLAHALSQKLGLPFVPTDDLYWKPNWQRVSTKALRASLDAITQAPRWVLDGNFDDLRELVWARADTILWLDYPRHIVLPRLVRRNIGWYISQEPVWSENTMTFEKALSGIQHSLRGHAGKRQMYPEWLEACSHAQVRCFRRPSEAARWLESL